MEFYIWIDNTHVKTNHASLNVTKEPEHQSVII